MSISRAVILAVFALGVGFALGAWATRAVPHGGHIESLASASALQEQSVAASSPAASQAEIERWSTRELRVQYRAAIERERALQQQLAAARAAGEPRLARNAPRTDPARAQPTAAAPQPSSAAAPPPNPLKETFYPTSPERLAELARDCSVRVDTPPVLESTPGELGNVADELHASPAEERVLQDVLAELHREVRSQLRSAYEEVVGRAPSPDLSARALLGEIFDKTPPNERRGVMQRVARERAGELPPRDLREANAYERSQRVQVGVGDRYQELLARKLGAARASELRAEQGGWPWGRSIIAGCGER